MKIPLLYADEDLLVVIKPAGLRSTPDGWDPTLPHLRAVLEPEYGRLWLVHRLDKDASGVMVLARNAQAHRALSQQWEAREVEKVYHALTHGEPDWQERVVQAPLRANVGRRKRTVVHPQGKPAETALRVIRRLAGYALVEARPKTGRRHQVRVHLYHAGHPIVADPLYGPGPQPGEPIGRLALHARRLAFRHPRTGEPLRFTAPHPDDFAQALEKLEAWEALAKP